GHVARWGRGERICVQVRRSLAPKIVRLHCPDDRRGGIVNAVSRDDRLSARESECLVGPVSDEDPPYLCDLAVPYPERPRVGARAGVDEQAAIHGRVSIDMLHVKAWIAPDAARTGHHILHDLGVVPDIEVAHVVAVEEVNVAVLAR